MNCGPNYESISILDTNVLRRDDAITLLTVSFMVCNSRKYVKTIAQLDTGSRTTDSGVAVGY